jgi:hypothetical protein
MGALLIVFALVTVGEAVTSQIRNNNLRLYGKIINPKGYVTIGDDMVINEKLNAKGNISDSNGNLTLDDTVAVTGDLIVEGGAEVKGELYNSNDVVTVNDDLTVAGLLAMNSIETPTESTCTTNGGLSYDTSYLYLCVDGTWKKVTLQTL